MFPGMPPAVPWTPDLVAEQLVSAFRRLPDHPVMSRGRCFVDGDIEVEPFGWPERFIADPWDRRVLMTWASCRASGASITKRFKDLDWQPRTAERHRRTALAAIARGLNAMAKCNESLTMSSVRLELA